MITSQETRTQRVEAFGLDVQFRVTHGARLYVRNVTKMGCCNGHDRASGLLYGSETCRVQELLVGEHRSQAEADRPRTLKSGFDRNHQRPALQDRIRVECRD